MKKILCIILSLVLLIGVLASCGKKAEAEPEKKTAPKYEDLDFSTVASMSNVTVTDEVTDYVVIDVNNFGPIVVRLFPDVAPETVANFKRLVSEGFYNGLTFHRIIENFMIQGGDPNGDGTGGSNQKINGEFTSNNFENNLHHVRGVVSMARRGDDPNSASSQFFIVHKSTQNNLDSLDGNYASFGYVVYGMDVVDTIAGCRTDYNDKPVVDVIINSIKFAKVTATTNNTTNNNSGNSNNSNDFNNDNSGNTHVAPKYEEIDLSTISSDAVIILSSTPTDYVYMKTNKGNMVIRLFPEVAPETVANFKKLVSEGFYDGLTFHRVISGFMIQGGDPNGNGTGGSGTSINGEFTANGFENNLGHVRGVISMARASNPDSASSQFFIVHETSANNSYNLDGRYASFGYVVYGQEVIDAIAAVETNESNNKPVNDVVIEEVLFVTVAE